MDKKYSLFANYKFIIKEALKWSPRKFALWWLQAIVNAILPFVMMLIPSFIVFLLKSGVSQINFIKSTLIVFIGLAFMRGFSLFIIGYNDMQFFSLRSEHINRKIFLKKLLYTDYCNIEPEDKRRMSMKARSSLWMGNWSGVEGFCRKNVDLLTNCLCLMLYSLVIGNIHPGLILFLIIISGINYLAFHSAHQVELKNKDVKADLNKEIMYFGKTAFNISIGKDIRIYQLQNWLNQTYQKAVDALMHLTLKEKGAYFLCDGLSLMLQFLRDGISYGYLIYLLTKGLDVSLFVLYLGAIAGFSTWFVKIMDSLFGIFKDSAQISDLQQYLALEDEFNHGNGIKLDAKDGFEVVMEHVDFQYPGSNQYILKDFSLTIKNNEKLALVGINGAGKTTIVKLLCGLYKPTKGRILINGVNLNDLDIDEYMNAISVVFQDSYLIAIEIYKNIALCAEEFVNRERVIACAKLAGIHDKIATLPKAYDTFIFQDIDESGIQLSGGQKQKLMLARALYKNGSFLILDEPTAALDAISESQMYEKYQALTSDKTSIFISHRLASTRFCDRIIFLENGRIIESGTHEELINAQGEYANMYEVQSQYYKDKKVESEDFDYVI